MSESVVSLAEAKRGRRSGGTSRPPDAPNEAPKECPVTPLGHRDGQFWFFDRAGQIRALSAQQLGQSPQIVALFCGDTDWCTKTFPQLDKEGQPTGWFSVRAVGKHLVTECTKAGLFRPEEPRRGIGVWRAQGQVALHLGDRVFFPGSGVTRPAGFRDMGALWPALPRVPAPAAPATAEQAAAVEAVFSRWNWEQPFAVRAMFGLWAAGLLGAAIRWRPHGLVVGPAGSGKTTLMETYAALSPLALMWNDYTEAGLRQAVTGRAGPLILDEAEGDAEGVNRLQKVVELLRRASGGGGAQVVRGSAGGQSQTFEVTSAALLGCILPPNLLPQDASRITRVDLLPRAPDGPPLPSEAEMAGLRAQAPALWGRALAGMDRFAANLETFRRDLLGRGCPPRLADQIGTILAARAMMLHDEPVTEFQAKVQADHFRPLLMTEADQAPEDGPGAALLHLLQSVADVQRHGERPSIASLLARGQRSDPDGDDARRILREHGLAMTIWPPGAQGVPLSLAVANTHPRLARIYEGTRWAGGRWKEDLRRLPGVVVPKHPSRLLPGKPRVTIVPATLLPEPERSTASGDAAEGGTG